MHSSCDTEGQQKSRGTPCAECKRLRLQCDKRIPCRGCLRRGCEELCPNGTKVTAEGTRLVLAATKKMHDTVKDLRARIRSLETALNDLHLDRTGHTHPMLSSAKVDQDAEEDIACQQDPEEELNPMQTIALVRGRDGAHRMAAIHGRMWVTHSVGDHSVSRSAAIAAIAHQRKHYPGVQMRRFLFGPVIPVPHSTIVGLQQQLPPTEIMDALLAVYHQSYGATGLAPAFSDQYIRSSVIPNARHPSGGLPASVALGSLFTLLAIGSLFAIDDGEAPEVAHYADLSAAAIAASGVMSSASIELIEALYLQAVLDNLRQGTWEEPSRAGFAMAAQMCIALGLHRDGAAFGLRPEVCERRRVIFWMIYRADIWENLSVGRPAVFSFGLDFIDAQFPNLNSKEASSAELARIQASTARVITSIANITLLLKPPSYKEILDMDETVRKLVSPGRRAVTPAAIPLPLMLLIYLHRAFYARALKEHGHDLSQSVYYYSVHAILRSARDTLSWTDTVVRQSPAMCSRFSWIWSIAVTATMVYKVMLEHSPDCEFASEARAGLDLALRLFELGSKCGSGRAKQALTMFRKKTLDDLSSALTITANAPHFANEPHSQDQPRGPRETKRASDTVNPAMKSDRYGRNLEASTEVQPLQSSNHVPPTFVDPYMHDRAALEAHEFTLWEGHGWINMDQGPMELTVPDGPDTLGHRVPFASETWLASLGPAKPGLTGSLNGEWTSTTYTHS